MKKKAGILGSGQVAQALAKGFLDHGYEVMMGSRQPEKLAAWKRASGHHAHTGTFSEAAAFGDLLVLAVLGRAAEEVVELAGPDNIRGKVIIDTTNPLSEQPPTEGVLKLFTDPDESLLERLQARFPDAHFVKAFNTVGNQLMVHPQFSGGKPSMFFCGRHAAAKKQVSELLELFGWEPVDMGGAASARALEQLCMLWCIPGFLYNQWNHAFRLLRQ